MTSATRYRAARIWDGSAVHRDAAVDVVDGHIVVVGPITALPPPRPAGTVHDLGDVTVLPGLINAHVHLAFAATEDVVERFTTEQEAGGSALLDRGRANLAAALASGVTTVRDLGTPSAVATTLREEVQRGVTPGPSVITSTSPLTTPGGHCHFLSHEVPPGADPARWVDRAVAEGADLVKVFASGGNLTPGSSPLSRQFDQQALQAVVAAAAARGMGVAAHAHGADSVADSVAAGVMSVEHCSFGTPDGPVVDAAVLRRMADQGTIAVPTIGTGLPSLDVMDLDRLPPELRDKLMQLVREFPRLLDVARATLDAGVDIALGTDAGIPHRPFDDVPASVAHLGSPAGLGLSAAEALRTATVVAARACGLDDRGRLAPGLRADLLVVEGDPLHDLTDLARTRLVVIAGEEVFGRAAAPA